MTATPHAQTGWKPLPIALKILAVVMVLWTIGAIMNLPNLQENGLPLFGVFVFGTVATLVVLALDIIGPAVFLFGLWHRKSWAPKWASLYIGVFILNSLVAVFTVSTQLGLPQILVPTLAAVIFLTVILRHKSYFVN